ncbi:MAG TPA: FUSC family protein, partial [Magnetospirillum sp.]|nr:FUSC family protein [Magnetospirillum sp.]
MTAMAATARLLPRLSLPVTPAMLAHAARTTLAALAALWIAYALQLPFSGAVTVLIVAHPVHGTVLLKSLYRLLGTLVGGAMSVLLMGLFSQSPEMFMLALGLWMALCTLGSTLLRNFQSYATVLAGYT